MRMGLWFGLVIGFALWGIILQRRLEAALKRGDMYRDVAARLDRRLHELTNRG